MMENQVENKFSLVHGESDKGLVLSADAKPRLKWTPELHQHFVDVVSQLGGAGKATPKMVMREMGVPGLTLYHLKSHLQKYRLSRNQQSGTFSNKKKDCTVTARRNTEIKGVDISVENLEKNHSQINENLQIAKALQMQLGVQQKLHEQIEVQRHLQLRIEAQGKYLQSVLKKAQETLAGFNSSCLGLKITKEEFSELASLANIECPSSSFSELTEMPDLEMPKRGTRLTGNFFVPHQPQFTDCSMDSCLTSSESSDRKDEKLQNLHMNSAYDQRDDAEQNGTSVLQPIQINSNNTNLSRTHLSNQPVGEKSTRSNLSVHNGVQLQVNEKLPHQENFDKQLKRFRLPEDLDLNR